MFKAFNFSGISDGFWGRIFRAILNIIPDRVVLWILQGPIRGYRWIKGSGVNGYWLGSYELSQQRHFWAGVREGDVVLDVGAHVGFYTLLASRLAGSTGKVFAFEPSLRNLDFLRRHVALNRCANVTIVPCAVGDEDGESVLETFSGASSTGSLNAAAQHGERVRVVSLDSWTSENHVSPVRVIKMDIEGFEVRALQGMRRILTTDRPKIFLATHSRELRQQCEIFLKGFGYRMRSISAKPEIDADDFLATYDGEN